MKKFALLFAIIFFVSLFAENTNLLSKDKIPYYLVLDGIEDQKGNGIGTDMPGTTTTITNLIDLLYWDVLTRRDDIEPFATRRPFTTSSFVDYPIHHYDYAIFPLGTKGLSYSAGGITVMDQIQSMIDQGKDMIICGHGIFTLAQSDPKAKKFLEETLGLDPVVLNMLNGNTLIGTDILGENEDRVSQGAAFHINGGYAQNGAEMQYPIRYYTAMEAFDIKSNSKFMPMGKIITSHGAKYVGGRIQIGDSKIVFWSFDWANMATSTVQTMHFTVYNAINWFLEDVPFPDAYLETQYKKYDFGSCEVGDSLYKVINIRNYGREPLVVTGMRFWEEEESKFTLKDTEESFTLAPNNIKKIMLQFKPDEKGDYTDDLIIASNSMRSNGESYIGLEAVAGKKENYGPYLSVTDYPIDFGRIKIGQVGFADIEVTNIGTANLVIDSLTFVDKAQKDFVYGEDYKMPQVVIPGNTFSIRIKFVPLEENKKYSTEMIVGTNGLNDLGYGHGIAHFTLQGETIMEKRGADCQIENDEIMFGKVSEIISKEIIVKNTGELDLIYSTNITADDPVSESVFSVTSIAGASDVTIVKGGEKDTIIVAFDPIAEEEYREYYAYLEVTSNSQNPSHKNIEIYLYGEAENVVDIQEQGFPLNNINAKIYPHPISTGSNSTLNVEFNKDEINNVKILLVDMTGKTIRSFAEGTYTKGIHNIEINSNGLTTGSYILVISANGRQENLPFVIK